MPLKFAPRTEQSGGNFPLAVVYTLRHENAIILQSYSSKWGNREKNKRRRTLHSLFTVAESLKEREPLQQLRLSQSLFSPSNDTWWGGLHAAIVSSPPELPPLLPEKLKSLPHLSLQHDIPSLPFEGIPSSGQREELLRSLRAKRLQQTLANNDVTAMWEKMLVVFHSAWTAKVYATVNSSVLSLTYSSNALEQSEMLKEMFILVQRDTEKESLCFIDPVIVPSRTPCRVLWRRLLLYLRHISIPTEQTCLKCALLTQEEGMQHYFYEITRLSSAAARELPPAQPPIMWRAADVWKAADAPQCLELLSVVVPYVSREKTEKEDRRRRRRQCCAAVQFSLKQMQSTALMPKCMNAAVELRFMRGKQARQTLTLRNTVGERLKDLCATRYASRRRRRAIDEIRAGTFTLEPSCTLVASLHATRVLFSDESLVEPQRCCWKHSSIKAVQLSFSPPPPSPPFFSALHMQFGVNTVLPSPAWRPLAFEEEEKKEQEDGEEEEETSRCLSDTPEDLTLFPWRVFSREEELRSFEVLRECGREWRSQVGFAVERFEEDWYQEAFLHDVRTMPLPYREISALVEDAKLHYCYCLALHRERRRLGLYVNH